MWDAIRDFFQNALKYASRATMGDIADIIIVAVLLYWLFQLLRNSSAMRVIRGVVLLILVVLLSKLLQLQLLTFLMESMLQVGLLAVIILFQPELRRILEQMGATSFSRFLGKSNPAAMDEAIVQTVDACKALSWAREGALIVFERRVQLTGVVNTGTVLDGSVSGELLKNIFYPKAPLHDGAVIVRDARIAGAGCMLPLTSNNNLSKELGMRHRAGIGMSENSDAVVVIVSEETGSISVATDGLLKRHLTPDTLEKILRSLLLPQEESEKQDILSRAKRWLKAKK